MTCNPKESRAVAFRVTKNPKTSLKAPNQACKLLIFLGIFLSATFRPKTTDTPESELFGHRRGAFLAAIHSSYSAKTDVGGGVLPYTILTVSPRPSLNAPLDSPVRAPLIAIWDTSPPFTTIVFGLCRTV